MIYGLGHSESAECVGIFSNSIPGFTFVFHFVEMFWHLFVFHLCPNCVLRKVGENYAESTEQLPVNADMTVE